MRVTIPVPTRSWLRGLLRPRPYREVHVRRHEGRYVTAWTHEVRVAVVLYAFGALAAITDAGWLTGVVSTVLLWASTARGVRWVYWLLLDSSHWSLVRRRFRGRPTPVGAPS